MNNHPNLLRRGAHTTYERGYHFVWIPKYRRPVLTGAVRERLHEMLQGQCQFLGLELDSWALEPDHVHLFLGAPPCWSPADIAQRLKSATGQQLRTEFPHLRHQLRKDQLWARGYFVSSVSEARLTDNIRTYIRRQGHLAPLEPVPRSDQLCLF